MAAPVLRAVTAPAITTGAVNSPAATVIGDLMIFVAWSQGADQATLTHTIQSGFDSWINQGHNDGTDDGRFSIAVKVAALAGTNSYTPWSITNATAGQISIGVYVVRAGTYDPTIVTALPAANISAVSGLTNTAPNSPQLTPTTGLDYLFLSIGAWHVTSATATVATTPTSYVIQAQNSNASHVTHLAIADRTMTALAAAENPGGFGDNVTPNGTIACTVAIPGAPSTQTANADLAIATGTALNASVTPGGVTVASDVAIATCTALNATASSVTGVTANADLAIATGTALGASVTPGGVTVASDVAIATGTALGASVTPGGVTVASDLAIATGTALDASVTIGVIVTAGVAIATGTALDASATPGGVTVAGDLAIATGTALNASVTPGGVIVAGDLAIATGTALNATASNQEALSAGATVAVVVATALDATVHTLSPRGSNYGNATVTPWYGGARLG